MQPSEYNSGYPNISNCPNCGSTSVQLMTSYSPWFTPASHVLCIDCQMQGPIACSQLEEDAIDIQDLECLAEPTGFEIAAIAAWNQLPRALTWTTEPPKVAGWYLRRHNIAGRWSEADVMNFTRLSVKNSIIRSAMIQWAGPIPTPLEPGES